MEKYQSMSNKETPNPASPSIESIKSSIQNAIDNKSIQLVDVRTTNECNNGHISKALNIDFFNRANFQKSFENLDKEKPVYLYCRSGNRSQKAAKRLLKMGFIEIIDLKGGYSSWQINHS